MKIIKTRAYARAGLIGNPSDGYYGKTICLIVKNFRRRGGDLRVARAGDHPDAPGPVPLRQPRRPGPRRQAQRLLRRHAAGAGRDQALRRLLPRPEIDLPAQNFSIRYDSNIPRQVGLAGSSAIITATIRALCAFYEVAIPREVLPGLILSVETEEIGIAAGLQDRVAQVYEGLVYMDFDREHMRRRTGTVATSRSTRGSCRRSTLPTSRTWPSSPTSSTTTSGSGTRAASGR